MTMKARKPIKMHTAMEENKEQKKLSYEELKKATDDLYANYQKLMREYRGAVDALNQFDATSFYLQNAFKVIEHPEMYEEDFVSDVTKKITYILTKFGQNLEPAKEEKGEAE